MLDTKTHLGAGVAGMPVGLAPGRTPTLSDKPILPASPSYPAAPGPALAPAQAALAPAEGTLAPAGPDLALKIPIAASAPAPARVACTPAGTSSIDASGPANSRLTIASSPMGSPVGSFTASPARQPSMGLPAGVTAMRLTSTTHQEMPPAKPAQTGRVRNSFRNSTNDKKTISVYASVGAFVAALRS